MRDPLAQAAYWNNHHLPQSVSVQSIVATPSSPMTAQTSWKAYDTPVSSTITAILLEYYVFGVFLSNINAGSRYVVRG
jgi:hypothetical protein